MRASGLTLVEVLVALLVLAVAMLAWARLEARAAQVDRGSQVRREVAAWMRSELRLQRTLRTSGCGSRVAPAGWRCKVVRTCLGGVAEGCEVESVRVTITPPSGVALSGTTAVWWLLQAAPVGGRP